MAGSAKPKPHFCAVGAPAYTHAQCPCTPPSTLETFGEKSSAEACSGKEIAGLLKKRKMMMMMMMNNDDTKNRILACQTGGR